MDSKLQLKVDDDHTFTIKKHNKKKKKIPTDPIKHCGEVQNLEKPFCFMRNIYLL